MPEEVSIYLNGTLLRVPSGASVAAAILQTGDWSFRRSVSGEPRAPLCGMGTCFECRATVNGRPNCRTCQIAVEDEMIIKTG
jgi:sarcosine oxidase subunit alpha